MTDERTPWSLTRRELLAATAAAVVVPWLSPRFLASFSPTALAARVLTPAEFALVDELSEMIIPTDAHSPGARAARVAGEIDRRLADSLDEKQQASWRAGLRAVNELSRQMTGVSFLNGTPAQRLAVLTRMAANERDPKTPAERFFGTIKDATAGAYYTSKIGIHQDQDYKGNVYQPGEYAGYDATP
jgi:hypothetical protein